MDKAVVDEMLKRLERWYLVFIALSAPFLVGMALLALLVAVMALI